MQNFNESNTEGVHQLGRDGSMKWIQGYDIITGSNNSSVTSLFDQDDSSLLTIGNLVTFRKSIKSLAGVEGKTGKFGHGPTLGDSKFVLDVKGDSNFSGKINGVETHDLGRLPKIIQNISVSSGRVITIPYSGSFPNRIRVLLNGSTEVLQSKTDGYIYSIGNGNIDIRCGSNSIGSTFDKLGKITDHSSGDYTVQIF